MTETEYEEKIKELTAEVHRLFKLGEQRRKEGMRDVLSACLNYCSARKDNKIGEAELREIARIYRI